MPAWPTSRSLPSTPKSVSLPAPPNFEVVALGPEQEVGAAGADEYVVARRAGLHAGGARGSDADDRVGEVVADQDVVAVAADERADVGVDDVLLRPAGLPAGRGLARVGEGGGDPVRPAIDDVQPLLLDGGVGEGVRAGVAEDLVVAEPGDDRVVALVAVDHGQVRRRGAAAADEGVVAGAAADRPAVAAHQGVVAAAAEDRVVAGRRVDHAVAGAHRGGPDDRVGDVAADQEVVLVGADQGPDVVVDDVLLLAADRPARAGRTGLGEPDEDAGAAIDDAQIPAWLTET